MADTDTPAAPEAAAKPARRRTTTPAKAAAAKPKARKAKADDAKPATAAKSSSAKAPPKPRTTKRSIAAKASTAARTRKAAGTATDKVGGKWGVAAIAGGIAAAGAAAAALLSLRGSTKPGDPATSDTPPVPAKIAHQPDGKDASKSFKAGIADENTIPG